MSAMSRALDDLHRMHDRPLPAAELRAALLGGPGAAARFGAEEAAASHARLAAQVRVAIARRRLQRSGRVPIPGSTGWSPTLPGTGLRRWHGATAQREGGKQREGGNRADLFRAEQPVAGIAQAGHDI